MDIVRTCYTRKAKFFRDSDMEIDIKWYRAPAGAKTFPVPHKMNSLFWYSKPWNAVGVGEVFESKHTWSNGKTPPTVTGQNYCGTLEDFTLGPKFDAGNVTLRDLWGIPPACPDYVPAFPGACVADCYRRARIYCRCTFVYFGTCFPVGSVVPLDLHNGTAPYAGHRLYLFRSQAIPWGNVTAKFAVTCDLDDGFAYFNIELGTNQFVHAGYHQILSYVCFPFSGISEHNSNIPISTCAFNRFLCEFFE